MNIIFAVTEEQFDVYNLLKENIEGSSAGTLSNDSSNIVELVKAQYQVRFWLKLFFGGIRWPVYSKVRFNALQHIAIE